MENLVVVQKLNVAGFEFQIKTNRVTTGQLIQQVQCFDLFGPQPGNGAMTLGRVDKVPGVDTGDFVGNPMKNGKLISLSFTFRNLSFAVYSERLLQHLQQIGPQPGDFMVDRGR